MVTTTGQFLQCKMNLLDFYQVHPTTSLGNELIGLGFKGLSNGKAKSFWGSAGPWEESHFIKELTNNFCSDIFLCNL